MPQLPISLDRFRAGGHVWQCKWKNCPFRWNDGSQYPLGEERHEPNPQGIGDGGCVLLRARMDACGARPGGGAAGQAGRGTQRDAEQRHAGHARPRRQRCKQFPAHQRRLHPEALSSRRADQCRRTCGGCGRPGSSRPTSRNRWKPRPSWSTGSCMSRPRSARSMRSTRRPASSCGTTSNRSGRSRPIAAARTIAASRSTRTRSISPRSTPSWSRSTPRPETRCGSRTSPTPSSATARPWRRLSSRARC